MRVVFDTNIFVSALTLPGGRADQALRRIIDGHDSLVLSPAIIDEILTVLARKFARDREQLARVGVLLASLGEIVEPREPITVLADEPDNRILECAREADAQVIVTGDRKMLAINDFEGIRLLTLAAYLEQTGG